MSNHRGCCCWMLVTMAESRRVQLTTLSRDASGFTDGPASVQTDLSPGAAPQAQETRPDETVRLVLTLFEPDTRRFPEFNYCQLIDNKMRPTDEALRRAEWEEEADVAAIQKKLGEKYGGIPYQHKKKDRIQDLVDIGYGYDEEDSFIDNSEAYDEFVPSSITTKFGGFYVNSGVLQFRQASDTETDDLSTKEGTSELTKKLNLGNEKQKPKKSCKAKRMMKSTTYQKTLYKTGLNEMNIKKKKSVKTLSVTSMLKKFQKEKEQERQKMEQANQMTADLTSATTTPMFPADAAGGGGSVLTDPLLSLIGSTNDHALIQAANTVDFDIDLDSLLDVSEENMFPKSHPQTAPETPLIQARTDDPTLLNCLSDAEPQVLNPTVTFLPKPEQTQQLTEASLVVLPQCALLPEGLPPALEDSIRSLMVAAKTSEGESKLKFFNPDINSILLDIELQCQEQSGQLRSRVYRHLSSFMPCSKDTLLKRAKKLLVTHEGPHRVEGSLQELKEAIERSMPEQMACFHENRQAYEQLKTLKSAEDENVEDKGGRRGGPKKLFSWNQEIRECLARVLREKMGGDKMDGKRHKEIEEYVKTLLDNEVKPLWPKGWMQLRVLMRESRKLLGLFTPLQVNKAKGLKRQSLTGGASTSSDGCNNLQGAPTQSEFSTGPDQVFVEESNISSCVDQEPELNVESKTCSSFLEHGAKLSVNAPPSHSLLDILAEQALAHEYPATLSQERLTAAVGRHWNFSEDKSPPLPPPPPQSSPVNFPESGFCPVVLPHLLQLRAMKRGCWPGTE